MSSFQLKTGHVAAYEVVQR